MIKKAASLQTGNNEKALNSLFCYMWYSKNLNKFILYIFYIILLVTYITPIFLSSVRHRCFNLIVIMESINLFHDFSYPI